MLCSFTAGIAGVVYASRLRSISTALDGGTLVLYAVAAAVMGARACSAAAASRWPVSSAES